MARVQALWKILVEIILILCVGFPLLAISLWVEPQVRGYHPDDPSLMLPFKSETISALVLAIVGIALNIATVVIIEFIRDKAGRSKENYFVRGVSVPGWVWESCFTIGVFTFGVCCQQLTSNLAKYTVGRLRPHFFDVCKPAPVINSAQNSAEYIVDYICMGVDTTLLKNARLSFPSAHSSFAMYCAVFFIMYVQTRGKWRGSKLLRHGFQFLILMGAWYTGLSRVVDHMHHWSDVAAGFLIGAIFALLTFVYILKPKMYEPTNSYPQHQTQIELPRPVLSR